MIPVIAKLIVVVFGVFLICSGLIMLFVPEKARQIVRKAGSTVFINYAEITIRMIPAAGLIVAAEYSRFPGFFKILGWFMLVTSLILYFVPRRLHHGYSVRCAEMIKPFYFRLISPLAFLFGAGLIYAVV